MNALYMTQEREEVHRRRLQSELTRKEAQLKKLYSQVDTGKEQPREKLSSMNLSMDDLVYQGTIKQSLEKLMENEEEKDITFNESNNWKRRIIYDTVNYTFQGKFYAGKVGDQLTIRKIKLEDSETQKVGYTYDEMLDFEKEKIDNSMGHELGVTQLIRLLIEHNNIPMIGHNTSMDWIYIIRQFIQPLGKTSFQDFIEIFKTNFPCHIDVKIIATMGQIKDMLGLKHTDVERLYKRTCQDPFTHRCPKFKFPEKFAQIGTDLKRFEEGLSAGALHTAMFDALLTGKTYAILANMLMLQEKNRPENTLDLSKSLFIPNFYGKVFVYGIHGLHWQSLKDDELNQDNQRTIDKDHVFHVRFPKHWRENDLYDTARLKK